MACLKLYSTYIVVFLLFTTALSTSLTESLPTSSSSSSDVELLLGKIKGSLQGSNDNLLLSSWNLSVPLCQWRGLKWVFSNGSPLSCSDLSSPQWANLSLYRDSSIHLLSIQLPSANLTGSLPRELGSIPESLTRLNLEKLNLSHNNFTGMLPAFGESKFGVEVFEGNDPGLCGLPLRSCNGNSRLSSGAIAGLVIGLMTGVVVLASLLIGYVQNKKRKTRGDSEEEVEEGEDEENCVTGDSVGGSGEGKLIIFQGGEHLTLEDVLNATGQVIEKTTYGTAYKAKLADGVTIALRLLREGSCKDRSSCLPVIKQLGRVRHENMVPLRAFYQGKRGEKLLIYDYLPNRTLHDLLHDSRAGKPVLNWARRHKIALGIARGLAYLHALETPITHGNVRSKNVLVDDFFVARLTEFGLDKLMVPAIADEMIALAKADGYKAPELQRMKKCNSRTDVYAFGILLLEILIGKKPGKSGRNGEFVDLPSIVKVAVLEETTMEVFDVEVLKGIRSPMEEGLVQALKLAMGCCAPVASVRPTMDEVVKQLEENRPRNRSALYSPTETRSEIGTPF
ncbi:LRR receptor-like kinase [Melia azedarach]|uniref:LRR receptor-like kinase n=1 Tax=Melia azedarach TaxID=155640 RepID=A0ACC1Z0P3_MELAZ|nr:LRR receptor-like kinase [Melia azedarach]